MWRVVLWGSMLLLFACGKTSSDNVEVLNDGAGAGGTAGDSSSTGGRGDGGSALGGTAGGPIAGAAGAAGARDIGCDDGWSGYVGCKSSSVCQEPESEFAQSAVRALCFPELGVMPVDGPCEWFFTFVGRCYDPSNEYWTYYYNDAEAAAASCTGTGQVYCENPHGVPAALVDTCRTACAEAAPDNSQTPECDDVNFCVADCFRAITDLAPACAECVIASITWEPGHCGDFECVCP